MFEKISNQNSLTIKVHLYMGTRNQTYGLSICLSVHLLVHQIHTWVEILYYIFYFIHYNTHHSKIFILIGLCDKHTTLVKWSPIFGHTWIWSCGPWTKLKNCACFFQTTYSWRFYILTRSRSESTWESRSYVHMYLKIPKEADI